MMRTATTAEVLLGAETRRRDSRHLSTQLSIVAMLGDAAVVFLSLAISFWLRFETALAHVGRHADAIAWRDYLGHVALGTTVFLLLLPHRSMYEPDRLLNLRATIRGVVVGAVRWLVAFTALTWVMRPDAELSRLYVGVAFITTMALLSLWRSGLHHAVLQGAVADRLRQRILFVGWSRQAAALSASIGKYPRRLYQVVGYVPCRAAQPPEAEPQGVECVGEPERLAEAIHAHDVDLVVLADPNLDADQTIALANCCEREMVEFKVIPSCFQVLLSCLSLQTLGKVPVLGLSRVPLDSPFRVLVKQVVDWAGGAVGLVLSAPLIVFFGLLVYWEDPGPIIYKQRRVGQHGRPFWIYKIRSMRMDAERQGVGWTVRNDPRRLRIGAFMRRWNIDELPQFWNVLKGDMSLVGPRPERPELIRHFKDQIPHYNARHNIKPGLTGWAQVNGLRGDTDLNERIRCDLYYIENWSLLLDLQILALTFVRHKNAG